MENEKTSKVNGRFKKNSRLLIIGTGTFKINPEESERHGIGTDSKLRAESLLSFTG